MISDEPVYERRIVKGTSPDEDKIIAIFEKTKDKIRIYYGDKEKTFIISEEKFKKMRASPRTGKYILVRYEKDKFKTLKEQCIQTISEGNYLKTLRCGLINLFRTGSTAKTALQLFYDLTPIKYAPEPICEKETEILQKAKNGALIWGTKYHGKAYKYDVVSEYASVMTSQYLKIPYGKPEFKNMTKDEFEQLSFYSYGIYHVKVHDPDYRVFRVNNENWYTHTDLNYARNELKYRIELVVDGECNAMLYKDNLQSIKTVFAPFVNYLFGFKKEGVKLIKKYLTSLWGKLCEKNTMEVPANDIHDDKTIFSMMPNFNDIKKDNNMENHIAKVFNQKQYFELSYARFAPFILASGRLKISNIILKNLDTCVKVHTDSVMLKQEIKGTVTGTNIGDLRYEGCGIANVIDSCTYTLNNEKHGRFLTEQKRENINMFIKK